MIELIKSVPMAMKIINIMNNEPIIKKDFLTEPVIEKKTNKEKLKELDEMWKNELKINNMQKIINYYVGIKIKEFRENEGLTQTELAKNLDIKRTTISNIEKGRSATQLSIIYQICIALNCEIMDLFPSIEWVDKNKDKKVKITYSLELI